MQIQQSCTKPSICWFQFPRGGLVQICSISIAISMEITQFCTKPSICSFLCPQGGKLTEEELNSLIAHAHRRIEQLQRQLAEQQALEQLRTSSALDSQQKEDEKLAERKVAMEGERLRAQFDMEKQKMVGAAVLHYLHQGGLNSDMSHRAYKVLYSQYH